MSTSASPRVSRTRATLVACCLLAATAAAPVMAQGGSPGPSEAAPASLAPASQPPAGATPGSAELVLSRVTLPDGLPKVPLTSVIAGGPGFIAVGGGGPEDGGPSQPLILTSADGVAWTTVDLGGVGDPGYLDDVVAFPGGYAAVGSGGGTDGQDAVALVSPDGLQWRESHDHDLRGTQMVGVTAWADGLFAVGIINELRSHRVHVDRRACVDARAGARPVHARLRRGGGRPAGGGGHGGRHRRRPARHRYDHGS